VSNVVVPVIREKLGDSKDSVRDKTQVLIQQIMQDSVSSVQVIPPITTGIMLLLFI
jgi:hypothetical protein